MAVEPFANLRVPVSGIVVEDDVDILLGWDFSVDGVDEADELLMAVPLHVAADDGAVEHVHRGEQCGGSVPDVVMGHGAEPPLLHRQTRLVRSSAWIWLFSSTDSTMACAGGST